MSERNTAAWDLHKSFPYGLPHRRVLRAEGGLLLSLDPAQHLFNTCLDPHVVQPYHKFAVGLLHTPPTLLSGLSLLPVRSRRSSCCFRCSSKRLLPLLAQVHPNHKSCVVYAPIFMPCPKRRTSKTTIMCIVLSRTRCHCVSCLDVNKCRDTAL